MKARQPNLYPSLALYVREALAEIDAILAERKAALKLIAKFIQERTRAVETAKLVFICTHNSRRSQIAQVWAQAAAVVFGVPAVEVYSGGTEAGAFNPRAVAALVRAGFRVERRSEGENPRYEVRYAAQAPPIECFSKVYDQAANPARDFCAVMTCSSADEACPVVLGAAERISLPYDDPGAFDGTDQEATAYDDRCRQIAREMLAVFSTARD